MYLKRILSVFMIAFMLLGIPFICGNKNPEGVFVVSAVESLEDDLSEETIPGAPQEEGGSSSDTGVAELFKNHEAVNSDQLNTAQETLSPFTNFIGYIIGGIMVIACVSIFLITALDLLYIAVPPLRGFLYRGAQDEMQGGAGSGFGGMGMSMGGARYGGTAQRGLRFQLISDEAVQCSMLIGGSQQGAGGGIPGGYMNTYSPQQEMSNKSIIGAYFKKRIFFMVLFVVCAIVLMSSIFLDFGINVAMWLMNMIELVMDLIPV